MKIAIIDLVFNWPPDGGGRVDVKEVFSRLALQHDVKMFVPQYHDLLHRGSIQGDPGFEIEPIPFNHKNFKGPYLAAVFESKLAAFKPDVVFITDGWTMKPWAAYAARRYPSVIRFYAYESICLRNHGLFMRGEQVCFRSHLGNPILDYPYCNACALKLLAREYLKNQKSWLREYLAANVYSPIYRKLTRKMLEKSTYLIVYNKLFQEFLRHFNDHVKVIPGAINPELFPSQPIRNDQTIRIGMVGRIDDFHKGYTFLQTAFVNLLHEGYNIKLWLTGDKMPGFVELPGIHFAGWMNQEDLKDFYAQVDICVVPSIWNEPFGMVAVEAMASNRPVVVTKVGGLQHIVTHGEDGLVVQPRSVESLTDALRTLVTNPDLRKKMGEAGRKKALNNYTWDIIVEKYYNPLLQKI